MEVVCPGCGAPFQSGFCWACGNHQNVKEVGCGEETVSASDS